MLEMLAHLMPQLPTDRPNHLLGRAVQVDSINIRVESAYGFRA